MIRTREATLLIMLTACLPAEEYPSPPTGAESAFLAIERDDHQFDVYASEVNDGVLSFPTIILDGERKVAVYFFGCSLSAFFNGMMMTFPRIYSGLPSAKHPRPLAANVAQVRNGTIDGWSMGQDLEVDLKLETPCPRYEQKWTTAPSDLMLVNSEFAWMVAGDDFVWVGSDEGTVYRVDSGGSSTSLPERMEALAVTRAGSNKYFALGGDSANSSACMGDSPTSMTCGLSGGVGPIDERLRLAVGSTTGIDLAAADASHKLRTTMGQGWEPVAICAPTDCTAAASTNVFVTRASREFVAGASQLGCLGSSSGRPYQLPNQPISSADTCLTLGGLDYGERWGIVASVEALSDGSDVTPATDLYRLEDESWIGLESVGEASAVHATDRSILIVGPTQVAEFFEERSLCRYPGLTNEGRNILAIAESEAGIFVLSEDTATVFVTLFVQLEALNTCAG